MLRQKWPVLERDGPGDPRSSLSPHLSATRKAPVDVYVTPANERTTDADSMFWYASYLNAAVGKRTMVKNNATRLMFSNRDVPVWRCGSRA